MDHMPVQMPSVPEARLSVAWTWMCWLAPTVVAVTMVAEANHIAPKALQLPPSPLCGRVAGQGSHAQCKLALAVHGPFVQR